MTAINPLGTLLANAYVKFDRDKDGRLDRGEFQSFHEILKPGIACDEENQPTLTSSDYFKRMDANRDGGVTSEEVLSTGVIMPSALCGDGSIDAMLQFLQQQNSETAALATTYLLEKEEPEVPEGSE